MIGRKSGLRSLGPNVILAAISADRRAAVVDNIYELPASTKVTGAIGVVLALALGIMAGRMRALGNQPVQVVTFPPQPHEGALPSDESGPANPPAGPDERAGGQGAGKGSCNF